MRVMRLIKATIVALLTLTAVESQAQFYSVRANALGWLTGTPNVGLDIALGRKVSVDFELMGNPIRTKDFSTQCFIAQEGMRFWLLEANVGGFLGFHFTQTVYDVGNYNYMFQGHAYGVGVSYGHSWLLAKRWNIGVEIGASVMYMEDRQNDRHPHWSSNAVTKYSQRVMFLPTKFSVSVVYLF